MPMLDNHHICSSRFESWHDFTLPGAEPHYPPDLEIEPMHLEIRLTVDIPAKRCEGSVITTVTSKRNGPTTLKLDAIGFENVAVQDADGHHLTWLYDGRKLTVEWSQAFQAKEERRVEVSYKIEEPNSGLFFSQPTEAYPDLPVFAATDHETERARYWLPCIDLPSVRPRLDFHLTADTQHTILANGSLVGETDNGNGTKTAHWRLDHPCPSYLTCFAIGDFVRYDDEPFEGRPIAYFAGRRFTQEHLKLTFGKTREMLRWMTAKLNAPFPFPKYYQFALPGFGGAMENISLVSWDEKFLLDKILAKEWSWLIDLVNIHEMAHSYFGDSIVCRDFAHAWLKESWATYMEQCWLEDTYGDDEKLYCFYTSAQQYFEEADDYYRRPLVTREYNSSWDLYDAHLYPGGACRLHTLRCELGDDTFWSSVEDYVARCSGKVVETDDFRRILEAHSGRSLVEFFDQWMYSPGYPVFKVTFDYNTRRKEGVFQIEQTQREDDEDVPVFSCTLDLGWMLDDVFHTLPVKINKAKQTVVIPMPKEPEQVRFDPHGKVLHKLEFNPGDDKLRRQLRKAPDVIGRIHAAYELAKTGLKKNLEAIARAYASEPFWGVRVEFAKALARTHTQYAAERLAEWIAREDHPLVVEAVFRESGQFRDDRVLDALTKRVARDRDALPYRTRKAAYEALGRQRDRAPYNLLADAARVESFGGFAQAGAYQGLAETRRRDAVAPLMNAMPYGASPYPSRPAAVRALADLGQHQERHVRAHIVERVTDLLRDPVPQVREAAVDALETLNATEAISAIEAYRETLPLQEQVRVDRTLHDMRSDQEPKAASLEQQFEDVQQKLRKVEEHLQKLSAQVEAPKAKSAVKKKRAAAKRRAASGAARRAATRAAKSPKTRRRRG